MWNAASRQFFLDQAKPYPYATGGDYVYLYEDTTTGKTYRVHVFLTSGTNTLNVEVGGKMNIFLIGGGGGGGHGGIGSSGMYSNNYVWAGGGGGGGVLELEPYSALSSQTLTFEIGAGGTGGVNGYRGDNGGNTTFNGLTAYGGGGGGGGRSNNFSGNNGGAGGGASTKGCCVVSVSGSQNGGSGVSGQGYEGGLATGNNGYGGGGGGAGSSGNANNVASNKGVGGSARVIYGLGFGGGGGAGGEASYSAPGGVNAGRGALSRSPGQNATNGVDGYGGGGGGGAFYNSGNGFLPGNGGNGGVVVAYVVAEKKLWTPSELTSLKAWWDAADETTIFDATSGGSLPNSGNDIARWEDKSGGGYHVTQTTAANRPHYVTNTLNGKPVIECTSQWLEASTASDWNFLHTTNGSTVVAIWKPGTNNDPNAAYAMLGTVGDVITSIGIQLQFDDRSQLSRNDTFRSAAINGSVAVFANFTGNNAMPANAPSIVAHVSDPGNATPANRSSIRINGGSAVSSSSATGTASTSNATYKLQLGAAGNNKLPLTGYIGEVVICNSVISNADRQKLEGYLAHKWGLTNNLPSGHPYKYEPPYKVEPEEIVTDGLVLNLDAGDYASYPRSGTTWYDISGNGLNGTLTNGPTYDSANKGSIVTDGVNDYINLGNNFNYTSQNFSMNFWINVVDFETNRTDSNQFRPVLFSNGAYQKYGYYCQIDANSILFTTHQSGANQTSSITDSFSTGVWYNFCVVRNGSSVKIYQNGTESNTNYGTHINPTSTSTNFVISAYLDGGYQIYGNIKISSFQIYNRALSSTEISQNFNALRGRYGI